MKNPVTNLINTMHQNFSRIFLLSHMRAFTSLAGHILGSNPAINGYFEMHLSYEDASALGIQLDEFEKYETIKHGSHYLFDKLLHNDYRLAPERLGPANLKILVALRKPESTIKSIVDLFTQKQNNHLYASPEEAANYYIERLRCLTDFCRTSDHDYYYFDTELFQAEPEALLSALTAWLELETPLSERYQIFSQTGKARKGDSSEFIHSGQIDRTISVYPDIHIPQPLLKKAKAIYQDCRQQMIENAADSVTLGPRKN